MSIITNPNPVYPTKQKAVQRALREVRMNEDARRYVAICQGGYCVLSVPPFFGEWYEVWRNGHVVRHG